MRKKDHMEEMLNQKLNKYSSGDLFKGSSNFRGGLPPQIGSHNSMIFNIQIMLEKSQCILDLF